MRDNLELMRCQEFADFLRVKCDTVYVWLCKKKLPQNLYRYMGRTPIFIKSEVEKWFLDGCKMLEKK